MTAGLATTGRPASVRIALALLLSVAVVLGLLGITSDIAFTHPSLLKYGLTVAAPLLLIALLDTRVNPQLTVGAGMAAVSPFSFNATLAGLTVSPLDILVVLALITHWTVERRGHRRRSYLQLGGTALVLSLLISLVEGGLAFRYVHLLVVSVAVSYFVAQECSTRSGRRVMVFTFVGSSTFQAALATYEFATKTKVNFYGSTGGSDFGSDYFFGFDGTFRAAAAFPDPIALGNVLALACPLAVAAAVLANTLRAKLVFAACGIVLVVGLVATLSRLSWIAAAVGVVVATVGLPPKLRGRAVLGVVATLGVALAAALSVGGTALSERFSSISDPTSSQVVTAQGDVTRLELQHEALKVGERHPVAGVGLGNLPPYLIAHVPGASSASHAHNTYYNVFAEAGFIGVAGLAALFAAALLDVGRGWSADRTVTAAGLGAVIALALCWLTDYTIRNLSVAAMVAIVFGIIASVRGEQEPA